jgi:hypothetical protein
MFNSKKAPIDADQELEMAIAEAFEELRSYPLSDERHEPLFQYIKELTELRKTSKKETRKPLSPDVVLTVVGNLAGIGAILNYERTRVVATKALGLIIKPRL